MRKKRLTGLKAYEIKRLIADAEETGRWNGWARAASMFDNASLFERLRMVFRGFPVPML